MLRFILLDQKLFAGDGPTDRTDSEDTILWQLEILTDRNIRYLKSHPNTPKLYESGVQYALPEQMAESKINPKKFMECSKYLKSIGAGDDVVEAMMNYLRGIEVFRDIPTILDKMHCDCDNLATFRAAELRMAGVKAVPMITSREREDGGTTYHALVRWPDNTSEDPSLLLGMGGKDRYDEFCEEVRKNKERKQNMLNAAQTLIEAGVGDAHTLGMQLDAMCLVPRGGWKAPWMGANGRGVGDGR